MSKRNVVINIKPFHSECKVKSNGDFIISFIGNIGGDYTRRKTVNIHLERWWIKFLARMIWGVIDKEYVELDSLSKSMKGGGRQ